MFNFQQVAAVNTGASSLPTFSQVFSFGGTLAGVPIPSGATSGSQTQEEEEQPNNTKAFWIVVAIIGVFLLWRK